MIVHRHDDTALALTLRPGWTWPLVLAGVGLAVFWLLADSLELRLTRTGDGRVDGVLQSRRPFWRSTPVRFHDLREARVGVHVGDRSPGTPPRSPMPAARTYRVELIDGTGRDHPMTAYFSSHRPPKDKLAADVNAFVAGNTSSPVVLHQPRSPWASVPLVLPLVAAMVVVAGRGHCEIDRVRRLVTVTRWGLTGRQRRMLLLDDVAEFRLVPRRRERQRAWNVAAVLHDGGEVPLTRLWSSRTRRMTEAAQLLERYRVGS